MSDLGVAEVVETFVSVVAGTSLFRMLFTGTVAIVTAGWSIIARSGKIGLQQTFTGQESLFFDAIFRTRHHC